MLPPWRTMVDLLTICVVSYSLLRLIRLVRALRIAGVLGFVYGAGIVAWHLDLPITARVLQTWSIVLMCLVIIVFQSEIRRSLSRVDAFSFFSRGFFPGAHSRNHSLAAASFRMAKEKTGALIVIVNNSPLDNLTDGGVNLHADVSPELIWTLFQKQSPVHDGAVLIREKTLLRAGVVLPLTETVEVPVAYGTRHRAAMGIAEGSDALAIVVSEERGDVTIMSGRRQVVVETEIELVDLLASSSRPKNRITTRTVAARLGNDWKLKSSALIGSALLLWGSTALSGNSERIIPAPVEFDNLAPGLDVATDGMPQVEVQVRGRSWVVDGSGLSQIRVHLDLRDYGPGVHTLPVNRQALALPPGLRIIRVVPDTLAVRVELRTRQANP